MPLIVKNGISDLVFFYFSYFITMDRQNQVSTMLLHCLICKEEGRDEDEAQFESHYQLINHIKDFHGLEFEGQKRGKQHLSLIHI